MPPLLGQEKIEIHIQRRKSIKCIILWRMKNSSSLTRYFQVDIKGAKYISVFYQKKIHFFSLPIFCIFRNESFNTTYFFPQIGIKMKQKVEEIGIEKLKLSMSWELPIVFDVREILLWKIWWIDNGDLF